MEKIVEWLKNPKTGRDESIEALRMLSVAKLKELGQVAGVTALAGRKDQIVESIVGHIRWSRIRN